MKKNLLTLAMVLAYFYSYSQNTAWSTSGNIGIGTVTPQAKLNVVGSEAIRITGTGASGVGSAGYISFFDSDNTTRRGYIGDASAGNVDLYFNADVGGGLSFGTNNIASRMVITAAGNVGIGDAAPAFPLVVAGATQVKGLGVFTQSSTVNSLVIDASSSSMHKIYNIEMDKQLKEQGEKLTAQTVQSTKQNKPVSYTAA